MNENETIAAPVRVLYPGDCDERDGNREIRGVAPAKSILSRIIGKTIWPGLEPAKPVPPPPPVPPQEELARLEAQLPFLRAQLDTARRIPEADPTRVYSTSPAAVAATSRRYRDLLSGGTDLAAMPLTDLCLLRDTLHTVYNDGFLDLCEGRIFQLRQQLRTTNPPKAEHKRLIKAAENALRNFGEAYRALRTYERSGHIGQAHQFHSTRPDSGFNFLQFSATELGRLAEFAQALPDPK